MTSPTASRFQRWKSRLAWILLDAFAFTIATGLGHLIYHQVFAYSTDWLLAFLATNYLLYTLAVQVFHLQAEESGYLSVANQVKLCLSMVAVYALTWTGYKFAGIHWSLRFIGLVMVLTLFGVIGLRVWANVSYLSRHRRHDPADKQQIVVIGAGDGGSIYLDNHRHNGGDSEIIAVLDRDPAKQGSLLVGHRVLGGLDQLNTLSQAYDIDEVVVAIPSISPADYIPILNRCNQLKLKVTKMPHVETLLTGSYLTGNKTRPINIDDLLGRQEVQLDETRLVKELQGKTILVTGAGGSIGSEIVRQISRYYPRKILLLGHGENSIYQIYHEMLSQQKMIQYQPIIADIKDSERLRQLFATDQVDIVYHAAAHKHVPLMEANPREVYTNNILGTYRLAQAVHEAGVPKMVMISTDKAIKPLNVMGASKRVAELIMTAFDQLSESTYCMVRFGNVLGSRGSVIPLFQQQIAQGGPVTVTDFRMERYFMTIPEGSRLVIYAGAFAHGGEVFVLNMGEPVKILDLARNMILLSGYTEEEIPIVECGIRPGEKLYEELILDAEVASDVVHDHIQVGRVHRETLAQIDQFIARVADLPDQALHDAIVEYANESSEY